MQMRRTANSVTGCHWARSIGIPSVFSTMARVGQPPGASLGRLRRCTRLPALAILSVVLVGCTQVKPKADFAHVRQLITTSTGVETVYDPDVPALSGEEMDAILSEGLTLDEALRIALLNNRQLHVEFMSIGVAKADWVQAGLLTNPTLGFSAQFPEGGGRSNIQTAIAQNLMDLWQIPERKKIAQATLDETILRIAHRAARLAASTKTAYVQAVAAGDALVLARKNLELVSQSHQAIQAQREAGTVSRLDENLARGQALSAELGVRRARLEAANGKRRLAQLLSIGRSVDDLVLTDPLVQTFDESLWTSGVAERLIDLARESRLDLRAMQHSVRARLGDVDLQKLRVYPEVNIGIAFERLERRAQTGRDVLADFARASLANGVPTIPGIQSRRERQAAESAEIDTIIGPVLDITLPIFDQNQAQIARAEYLYLRASKAYEGAFVQIAQEIRITTDRARTAVRNAIYYHDELVPQAELNLEFATASYSSGQSDILTLIEAQRLLLQAQRGYIDVRLEAATAMSDLEQAVGVPLK